MATWSHFSPPETFPPLGFHSLHLVYIFVKLRARWAPEWYKSGRPALYGWCKKLQLSHKIYVAPPQSILKSRRPRVWRIIKLRFKSSISIETKQQKRRKNTEDEMEEQQERRMFTARHKQWTHIMENASGSIRLLVLMSGRTNTKADVEGKLLLKAVVRGLRRKTHFECHLFISNLHSARLQLRRWSTHRLMH